MKTSRIVSLTLGLLLLGLAMPPASQSGAAMPDLMVTVRTENVVRDGRNYVRIRFFVKNVGNAPAGPSSLGASCLALAGGPCPGLVGNFDVGPPVPGAAWNIRLATPAIPAGGFVIVVGPRTQPWRNGNYRIRAQADIRNVVLEGNEANNTSSRDVVVP